MPEKGSRKVAGRAQPLREKTRFAGVYSRKLTNRHTGKPDTAFDITYKTPEGKKVWALIGYASDGVNASYASRKRGAILDGFTKGDKPKTQKAGQSITYGEAWALFAEKWLPTLARPQDELGRYTRYIEDALAHRRLEHITLLDIEELRTKLLNTGLSAATVRLVVGDIRRVYKKVIAWGFYTGAVPTDAFKMPKVDNARTRYLTQQEALTLLEALKLRSRQWHDIAFLSLHTGMRKGEILALRGEHLDFDSRRILVKDAKAGSRMVIMTDEVHSLLTSIQLVSPASYVFFAKGSNGEKAVRIDGGESFNRAVKDCGLNNGISDNRHKVVFHTLRHTYCSWLAISGVPLYTIGELVGHSSIEMTQRYSHLCPDAKAEAAARIGALLKRAKQS